MLFPQASNFRNRIIKERIEVIIRYLTSLNLPLRPVARSAGIRYTGRQVHEGIYVHLCTCLLLPNRRLADEEKNLCGMAVGGNTFVPATKNLK